MKGKGFTLIELLIVVAIIGILAAIALPNFLEAQVRAKVANTTSTMRNLAMALELYAVDFGAYPPNTGAHWDMYTPDPWGISIITTPIAYMTSPPEDQFALGAGETGTLTCQSPPVCWMYGTWEGDGVPTVGFGGTAQSFVIGSLGPNLMEDCIQDLGGGYGMFGYTRPNPVDHDFIGANGVDPDYAFVYDPTNGTVSYGDLFRSGP
jgi:type II secretion system protein G